MTDGPELPHRARKVLLGLALLLAAAWLGRDFGHHLMALEGWVEGHGALGMAAFVVAAVIALSVFVPETAIAIIAGVLFGVGLGTAIAVSGTNTDSAITAAATKAAMPSTPCPSTQASSATTW